LSSAANQILEGRVGLATITAIIGGIAVNDLLGSKVDGSVGEFAGEDVGTLDCLSC